jgi:hypothetical protein
MKKLWIFGDSFSDISGLWEGQPYYTEYCKQNTEFKSGTILKGWYDYLSEKLNYQLKQFSFSGGSNEVILLSVLQNLQYISKDDMLIIGWTRPSRFSIPIPTDRNFFKTIVNDGSCNSLDLEHNLCGSLNEYYKNVFVPHVDSHISIWVDTIIQFENYLNQNFNLKTWNWWEIPHETIKDEFNHITDMHPSVKGHMEIFEVINNMKIGNVSNWDDYLNSNKNNWN